MLQKDEQFPTDFFKEKMKSNSVCSINPENRKIMVKNTILKLSLGTSKMKKCDISSMYSQIKFVEVE